MNYPPKYFNRFNPQKNYKKLLFISGQGLQGAELNEIQDIIINELRNIASYLVRNGTITNGGEINSIEPDSIHILAGTVYADGFTISVGERQVPINGSGIEIIGMAVSEYRISYLEDAEITEPDQDSPNYGSPGSERLATLGMWKKSTEITGDEKFFPILTLTDGVLASTSSQTDNTTKINELISQYDYETNGSYVLSGLVPSYHGIDPDTNEVIMNIASGKARVAGQSINSSYQKKVKLEPINDKRLVQGEPHVFTALGSVTLRYAPVADIIKIQGIKRITKSVTHGSYSGASDLMTNTPVLTYELVKQGATTYVSGVDYIANGDSIDWTPSGAEPSPGSTYNVTYTYVSSFDLPVNAGLTGFIIDAENELVDGTTFFVDSEFYLKRIDRISLSSSGEFVISKGTPGFSSYFPPQKVNNLLSLGKIHLANGEAPVISIDTTYNLTFDQLSTLFGKIANLETNVAHLSLLENARNTDAMISKRNLIVDPLYDDDLRDMGSDNTAIIIDQELLLNSSFSIGGVISADYGLPYTESIIQQQNKITTSRKINPYATSSDPMIAEMSVNPPAIYDYQNYGYFLGWYRGRGSGSYNISSSNSLTYPQNFNVYLSRFNANETVNITFNNTLFQVNTDSQGRATKTLTAPANISSGSYRIDAVGVTSRAVASSTIAISASIRVYYYWYGYDPVAQTFSLNTNTDISSIAVYVTEKPQEDLLVRVCRVKVGIPDTNDTIGYGRLPIENINLGWNTIKLDIPVTTNTDTEYAFIIFTNKIIGSIATAKVGLYDNVNRAWVSTQAANGVFLTSANLSTWSPVQDEDMAYKIYAPNYSPSATYTLLTMTVSGITDWMLDGVDNIPDGASIRYYLEDSLGNTYDIGIGNPIYTATLSGEIKLKAEMSTTNPAKTPLIYRGLTLYIGTTIKPGIYTQNTFQIPDGSITPATIKLIIDVYAPSGASVVPSLLVGANYTQMNYVSATPVGDNWFESTYSLSNIGYNTGKLKIVLDTTSSMARPKIRKIRTLIS